MNNVWSLAYVNKQIQLLNHPIQLEITQMTHKAKPENPITEPYCTLQKQSKKLKTTKTKQKTPNNQISQVPHLSHWNHKKKTNFYTNLILGSTECRKVNGVGMYCAMGLEVAPDIALNSLSAPRNFFGDHFSRISGQFTAPLTPSLFAAQVIMIVDFFGWRCK